MKLYIDIKNINKDNIVGKKREIQLLCMRKKKKGKKLKEHFINIWDDPTVEWKVNLVV